MRDDGERFGACVINGMVLVRSGGTHGSGTVLGDSPIARTGVSCRKLIQVKLYSVRIRCRYVIRLSKATGGQSRKIGETIAEPSVTGTAHVPAISHALESGVTGHTEHRHSAVCQNAGVASLLDFVNNERKTLIVFVKIYQFACSHVEILVFD